MLRRRLYDGLLAAHVAQHRQMAFVTGPRQVGKTTACRKHASTYLSWDNADDRRLILRGPASVAEAAGIGQLAERQPVVMFDELHKLRRWKALLKGFFDTYADDTRILVTGSSRLDVFRRGGDSLMGRYFPYRMHPFSVAEVVHPDLPDPDRLVREPRRITTEDLDALVQHGGFPEPFIKRDKSFTRRWARLRRTQLTREDIRDLTGLRELGQVEVLVDLLAERSADQLVYSSIASEIQTSLDTVRRWVETLCGLHVGFLLRPWFKNVSRSLRKEPKWFLRDWSQITDPGKRVETFVACHLLKAVEGWTDLGLGEFHLGYLRDKERREVDFLVARDRKPWMLVEVKNSDSRPSTALAHFQKQTGAPYAFQLVMTADFVRADCFARPRGPLAVPAQTLLSQLL